MDKNLSNCLLCLSPSAVVINILIKKIYDKTVASLITRHFWFEVNENDGNSNKNICSECLAKVEDFHVFYTKVYNIHYNYGLVPIVNDDIKLEIDDGVHNENPKFVNNLQQNFDIKTELNNSTSIEFHQIDEQHEDTMESDVDDDKWSDQNCNTLEFLNESESSNSEIEDSVPESNVSKKVVARKKRTTKKLKITAVEQEKFEQQNKEISEYFSMDCELCSMKLDSFRNLQTHYRTEHKIKGYVRCCNKKYIKRVYILEHMRRHLNPDTFRCELCSKAFAAKRCLQLHMRSHVPSEERPFKCTECPKTYVIANLLKRHLETHATERQFACDECGKSYLTEIQLKAHQRNMHTERNLHICDVCAKTFRSKDVFEKHHQSVHGKIPPQKVQCKVCGAWVKHKYYLKQHMARHADSNADFPCKICGKSAPNIRALQSHIRVVHSEKVYECNLCRKTFKRSISLKEHMASHTGDILYSCPYCPKTFNSSANMYTHRKKSHVKEWEEQKLEKLKAASAT